MEYYYRKGNKYLFNSREEDEGFRIVAALSGAEK